MPIVNLNILGQLNTKQPTLVSGVNIKTVNETNILGAGNISVSAELSVGVAANQTEEDALFTSGYTFVLRSDLLPIVVEPSAYDNFTGTDGALAENHIGDLNVTWVKDTHSYAGMAAASIRGNTLQATNAAKNAVYYNSAYIPISSNYAVQASFTSLEAMGAGDLVGVYLRCATATPNHYRLQYYNGHLAIIKSTPNGSGMETDTQLGIYDFTWATGVTHVLKILAVGQVVTGYIDDVAVIIATDTGTVLAKGFGGFLLYGTSLATAPKMDNWQLWDK